MEEFREYIERFGSMYPELDEMLLAHWPVCGCGRNTYVYVHDNTSYHTGHRFQCGTCTDMIIVDLAAGRLNYEDEEDYVPPPAAMEEHPHGIWLCTSCGNIWMFPGTEQEGVTFPEPPEAVKKYLEEVGLHVED